WRARFTAISMPLAIGFSALAAGRGWQPVDLPRATPAHTAMAAIGAAWHTTLTRDPAPPLRGPWAFANPLFGRPPIAVPMSLPLAIGFSALAAGRGWQPVDLPRATPAHTAMAAIGAAWHTTLTRDPASPLRGPWRFANAMCGGALMAVRMSVPRARRPGRFGGSRPP